MSHPVHFPPTASYWSATKRRFKQIGKLIVFIFIIDFVMDHTVMYWRAHVFAENLCEALEKGRHATKNDLVHVPGSRPLGPNLSQIIRGQEKWGQGQCQISVRFGDTFEPTRKICSGIDYSIEVYTSETSLPTLRVQYDILENLMSDLFYGESEPLDVHVFGYHSYNTDTLLRYPLFLVRPFVCAAVSPMSLIFE